MLETSRGLIHHPTRPRPQSPASSSARADVRLPVCGVVTALLPVTMGFVVMAADVLLHTTDDGIACTAVDVQGTVLICDVSRGAVISD